LDPKSLFQYENSWDDSQPSWDDSLLSLDESRIVQ
jgi:hypothetical protein